MQQTRPTLTTRCPHCGQKAHFEYVGEQHWPEKVAEKRGVESVSLWTCQSCGTTLDGSRLPNGGE
ncbi:MAG: hypothetical protein OHK0046_22710 [Anaerolineae bacterium]